VHHIELQNFLNAPRRSHIYCKFSTYRYNTV